MTELDRLKRISNAVYLGRRNVAERCDASASKDYRQACVDISDEFSALEQMLWRMIEEVKHPQRTLEPAA
ncbi:hypothetical protein J2D73_20085 [Acetobacter sacchari]|uniref:Nucleotidyltransferase n=1 Tax=Acetobacter sacchari TaxID=2661687 RepID=A0ABS3M1S5_9PROT|nr:hypothetical protein [Acetobacter sacchari]MBO1362080.1 hypothetical protein [Acetobacter sacchari]